MQAKRKSFEVNIKKYANWYGDEYMVRKISSIDYVVKEIRCHGFCKTKHKTRSRKTPKGIEEQMK